MVYNSKVALLSNKNWKQNQKIFNTALILFLWVKLLLLSKNDNFLGKNSDISKIKRVLIIYALFSETTYLFLLAQQISSF